MIVCFCWFTELPFLCCFKFSCRTILNGSQNLSSSVHSFVVLSWLLASIWSFSWRCLNTPDAILSFSGAALTSASCRYFLPLYRMSDNHFVRQPLDQCMTRTFFFSLSPFSVPLPHLSQPTVQSPFLKTVFSPRYVTASLLPSCCVCFVFVSRGEHYMWTNVVHIVQNYVIDILIVCLVFNIECLLPKAIINYRHSKIMILYK